MSTSSHSQASFLATVEADLSLLFYAFLITGMSVQHCKLVEKCSHDVLLLNFSKLAQGHASRAARHLERLQGQIGAGTSSLDKEIDQTEFHLIDPDCVCSQKPANRRASLDTGTRFVMQMQVI